MKRIPTLIATVILMLNPGVAGIYAQQGPFSQQGPIKMTVSGTNVATTIDLQPGTITDEVNFAGNGTLGPFTYRELHADTLSPQSSSTCVGGTGLYVPTLAGGGVFRFRDGSLLNIGLTEGSLCIDPTAGVAHFSGMYTVTGGTGRFKGASGALTLNSTVSAVLFSSSNAPVLLTNVGEFVGQVFGVAIGEKGRDERQ
jgi:hypothetical protein